MAAIGRILRLQLTQLLGDRAVCLSLLVFVVASIFALGYGRVVISQQHAALSVSAMLQREQHAAVLAPVSPKAPAADQLYYLFFHTRHEPGPWAPFALGMRDVQPYNLKVRLLALHGQLYAGELVNPLLAAAGHVDGAFVLTWLSPLLVIALLHTLWAEEREQGTWALVRAQATSPAHLLGLTWALRVLLAFVPCLALVGVAVLWWQLPLDGRVMTVIAGAAAHVLFWSGLCLLVVARGYSSQVNALVLLGAWLLLAVVAPGMVTMLASARHPLPESLELTVRQRQGYHAAWDRPLAATMAQFYERYPAYQGAPVPTSTYSNAWYYAMQEAGDDAARPAAAAYVDALERRRGESRRLALLSPAATLQLLLTQVARTDVDSHMAYLDSVAVYHETLKMWFLPAIFDSRPVSSVEWDAVPRHVYVDTRRPLVLVSSVALWSSAGLAVAAGALVMRWALRSRP